MNWAKIGPNQTKSRQIVELSRASHLSRVETSFQDESISQTTPVKLSRVARIMPSRAKMRRAGCVAPIIDISTNTQVARPIIQFRSEPKCTIPRKSQSQDLRLVNPPTRENKISQILINRPFRLLSLRPPKEKVERWSLFFLQVRNEVEGHDATMIGR